MTDQNQLALRPETNEGYQVLNVFKTKHNGTELMIPKIGPEMQQLMLSMFCGAQLRRPRDNFEMVADPEFMDRLTTVAAIVDSFPYYRKGENRWKMFTQRTFRGMFDKGLADLLTEDNIQAMESFNIDQWYLDFVPEEYKQQEAPELQQLSKMTANQGALMIDWIDELQELEHTCPGIVTLLESTLTSEQSFLEKKKEQFAMAVQYQNDAPAAINLRSKIFQRTEGMRKLDQKRIEGARNKRMQTLGTKSKLRSSAVHY